MTVEYELYGLEFEWDDEKAAGNIEKHGVSFEEAASTFFDDDGLLLPDNEHSDYEDRLILIGYNESRVLTVTHVERLQKYRIISAREAIRRERREYERQRFERNT